MDLPFGVLAIYGALVVWVVLLIRDVKRRSFGPTLVFGIALLLVLNVRYLTDGAPGAIAFFVGIYDVLDNLGVAASEGAAALAPCANNACTVWGDLYLNHPSWGVAFYDRFLNGPELRTNLLYGHIIFNSIVFVLMHIQLARPGTGSNRGMHQVIGRTSFILLTIGTICAIWLASEHGSVVEYGGPLSMYGFWFMSLCVYGCAVMGVVAVRKGDTATHRIWMIRFAGSMWGAFWLFRIMLFVLGPLLRNWEAAALLICIWSSAPLGVLIAEVMGRYFDKRTDAATGSLDAERATAKPASASSP
ncbi:MAG: DUF2306 domain-containing protein [Rhodospirillales bacterium]|nr:DUF2306 domain-containing protein [Rhodospirillales bacterium]